jgi:hypothetical protein
MDLSEQRVHFYTTVVKEKNDFSHYLGETVYK